MIVQPVVEPMDHYTALVLIVVLAVPVSAPGEGGAAWCEGREVRAQARGRAGSGHQPRQQGQPGLLRDRGHGRPVIGHLGVTPGL